MDNSLQGYSADCSGHVIIGDAQLSLARLGPEAFELSKPVDLPRTEAEIVVIIDGDERRMRVSLDEGSSANVDLVSYRRL